MREKYVKAMKVRAENSLQKGNVDFAVQIANIEIILDLEEDMLASYYAIAYIEGKTFNEFTQMSSAIINKNLDYIYAAFKLTQYGQYAAARTIFRNIYESLIILKTVALSDNQQLLADWMDGKDISMRKKIFGKIISPQSEEMKRLWNDLCKFCHGTVFSLQQSYDYNLIKTELQYNYVVLIMLLYMNYHVLNRYVFANNMKAMADRNICTSEDDMDTKEKRDLLRVKLKDSKHSLAKEPRKVLTDFSKVWKFVE
ncbi:MAG: hypothetical protein MSH20_08625 [Lachnospiraceae bacterium]|nr:hypothetical protein [Lachnospiraceae bacterium]